MKRHRVGDGGEDALSNADAIPAHQKRVKVSEISKGKIRNDELKIQHGQ